MTSPILDFTGERFLPGAPGEIAHEHVHRYAFARRLVAGRRVLDVACGEGYGSALIAGTALAVIGVDVDPAAIAHAEATYDAPNVSFACGSAAALPLADASVDAVVSFETIEHLPAALQPQMLREFARVLTPGGVLVLSSPNRPEYSDARGHRNPFHLHELDRDGLATLLDASFPARRWYRQRRYVGSALWAEAPGGQYEALAGNARQAEAAQAPAALYFVVIAARSAPCLPPQDIALSLFTDADDREWQRIDHEAREVLRLDALLGERDASLSKQAGHIGHLETLVAYRDRIVEERDAALGVHVAEKEAARLKLETLERELTAARADRDAATQASRALEEERLRLEAAIGAQERIITYRQSARWWVQLPWVRVRNLWHRHT